MKFERALSMVNTFTEASTKAGQEKNKGVLTKAYVETRERYQNGHVLFEHGGQKLRVDMKRVTKGGWAKGYTFNVRYVTADAKYDA